MWRQIEKVHLMTVQGNHPWGLLCVGFFRKECFVRELYENLCYILLYLRSTFICMSIAQCSGDLCNNTLQFLAGKKSSRSVTHSISWRTFYLPVVTGSGHGTLFCDVVLSCETCSSRPATVRYTVSVLAWEESKLLYYAFIQR